MLVILLVITSFVPSGISKLSANVIGTTLRGEKFDLLKSVRKARETIVGNGCPKGRIWYYGKCKSLKELRNSDYDDIAFTNESETLTPKTTVPDNKFMETDFNLAIVPLSRPGVTTKLRSEMNEVQLTESRLESSESTTLATVLTLPVAEARSAILESKLTGKKPKTAVTQPQHILYELSSTVVETKPTETVTKLETMVTHQTFPLTSSGLEVSELPTVDTQLTSAVTNARSGMEESRPTGQESKTNLIELSHILYEHSSTGVDTIPTDTETYPTVIKPRSTVTKLNFSVANHRLEMSESIDPALGTFTAGDLTYPALGTMGAITDTTTKLDSTPPDLEISSVATETKGFTSKSKLFVKDSFKRDSTVTEPIPITTRKDITGTRTTVVEHAHPTTAAHSKSIPDDKDYDDNVPYIFHEVKSFMFTLMLVVGGVVVLNWIFEQLLGILYRRKGQECRDASLLSKYQDLPLSKEQESIV